MSNSLFDQGRIFSGANKAVSSLNSSVFEVGARGSSFMYSKNNTLPNALPWGTPVDIAVKSELTEFT